MTTPTHEPAAEPVSVAAATASGGPAERFGFRPWVRRSCRKALFWGLGAAALMALAAWWLRGPYGWNWARGLSVLVVYCLIFGAGLIKVWRTAAGTAVVLDGEALRFQPLHTFRPVAVPFAKILWAGPKTGQSLRVVFEKRGAVREIFLNLGLIDGRTRFLAAFGERLREGGLEPLPGAWASYARPGWEDVPSTSFI